MSARSGARPGHPLARLAGSSARERGCTIDVPREGDVVAWLRAAGTTNGVAKNGVVSDGNGAISWRADGGQAIATFSLERIDHATVERLAALLAVAIAAVTTHARLEHVSPLAAAERTPSRDWTDRRGVPGEATLTRCFASSGDAPSASRSSGTRTAHSALIAGPMRSRSA